MGPISTQYAINCGSDLTNKTPVFLSLSHYFYHLSPGTTGSWSLTRAKKSLTSIRIFKPITIEASFAKSRSATELELGKSHT